MFESASVFGLCILANAPLPGFTRVRAESSADIRLFLRRTPGWLKALAAEPAETKLVCPENDEDGRPFYRVSELFRGDFFRLCYSDGTTFIVDRAGTRIWVEWPATLSLEDISTYLFGPVIGWVLRLRGDVCLHASAIAVDGTAIAFAGASGAGKSTTAAAFAKRGCAVLADDVAAIFESPESLLVRSSYPELRLWPASAAVLYASEDGRAGTAPAGEKFRLDLRTCGHRFQRDPLPLSAIYILSDDDPAGGNPIRSLTHREAMMALIANTHAGRLLGKSARTKEFDLLTALVARVPVGEVSRGADLAALPLLCEAILADFEAQFEPPTVIEMAGA